MRGELYAIIKMIVVDRRESAQIKMINHTSTSSYDFFDNPFPLLYGIKLTDSINLLKLNLRLRNNFIIDNSK